MNGLLAGMVATCSGVGYYEVEIEFGNNKVDTTAAVDRVDTGTGSQKRKSSVVSYYDGLRRRYSSTTVAIFPGAL